MQGQISFKQLINKLRNKIIFFLQDTFKKSGYRKRLREVNHYLRSGTSIGRQKSNIVVSLTSYGERIKTVHLAIASIMDQTVQPAEVVLYLDKTTKIDSLPTELQNLCYKGLTIIHDVEDIRGHKKYFYAMKDFPDKTIVTIDDDVIYPRKALEQLVIASQEHPTCVIARRVHRALFDAHGKPLSYMDWLFAYRGVRRMSNANVLTGCGGTLFPPHVLPDSALDIAAIRQCALSADDIWLSCALRSNRVKIYRAPANISLFWEIEGSQSSALNIENINEGGNDIAMRLTMEHFRLKASNFAD